MGSGQWLCMAKSFKASALEVIWFDGLWKMVYRFWFQTRNSYFLDTAVIKFRSETGTFLLDSIIHLYNLNLIFQFSKLFCKPYLLQLFFMYLTLFKERDPTGSGPVMTWKGGSRAVINHFGLTTLNKNPHCFSSKPGDWRLQGKVSSPVPIYFIGSVGPTIETIIVANMLMRIWWESPNFQTFKEPKNRFQGANSARLCRLTGRNDNPVPTRLIAP